jgi:hypothetical protein
MRYSLFIKTGLSPVCPFCEPAFPPDDGRYRQPKHVAELNKNPSTKSTNFCCSENKYPNVHYHAHNSRPLIPILNKMNPVHALPLHFSKIHFIIILPIYTHFFQMVPFLQISSPKSCTLFSPMRATCPTNLILLDLITRVIQVSEDIRQMSPFSQSNCYFLPVKP